MTSLPGLDGARVLVYSLGIEGRDLARWLVAKGARVTISDTRSEELLRRAGATAPAGVERVVSGQDLLDPEGYDVVAVSQSVLRHDAAMVRARELGIPTASQMQLFLQLCRGRTVGITGSSGKTTTTSLVAAMAKATGIDHVVGGNIGQALLGEAEAIDEGTTVILEISHSQLQYTDRSPRIAAITNVTPNHLDQFDWPDYVGLKRNILAYQEQGDVAVLNDDDETSKGFVGDVRGELRLASMRHALDGPGAWLDGRDIVARMDGQPVTVVDRGQIRLRGEHNVANVVMATAIGAAMGLPVQAMATAIADFGGVAHRLEPAGTVGGVTYINDSIATAPERTLAGMRSFDEPIVLLLGGRDKKLPMEELVEEAGRRCRAVICFGESGPVFHAAFDGTATKRSLVGTLEEAVVAAAAVAQPGDVVLLAPGGTSFEAYPSFESRGAAFRELVRAMPGYEGAG
jgi:UDP-N-acetylmuramoylalanine--D-glutamate ligase